MNKDKVKWNEACHLIKNINNVLDLLKRGLRIQRDCNIETNITTDIKSTKYCNICSTETKLRLSYQQIDDARIER